VGLLFVKGLNKSFWWIGEIEKNEGVGEWGPVMQPF